MEQSEPNSRQKRLLQLEAFVKSAIDGIITFDSNGIIESVNTAVERLFRCSMDNIIGESIECFLGKLNKEDRNPLSELLSSCKNNLVGSSIRMMCKRKDGTIFPVRLSISEIDLGHNKLYACIVQGIQDQYLAEQKMWQEKARAQQYLNVANTVIVALDRRGNIILFNKKGEEIMGYSEGELIGRNWVDVLLPPSKSKQVKQSYEHIMQGAESLEEYFENTIIAKDGKSIEMAWHNSLLYDMDNNIDGVLVSGNDVTQKKKNERELNGLNNLLKQQLEEKEMRIEDRETRLEDVVNKLIQENKDRKIAEAELRRKEMDLQLALEKEKELNEMKSRFVSMASHEFRTPLSTILSSASLLSRYTQTEQQLHRDRHIQKIKSAVQNLNSILQDFLSYSKLEEGKVEVENKSLELVIFCNNIVEEMSGLLKKDQQIIANLPDVPANLNVDGQLLKNTLLNLLSNAIKYSPEGKKIVLSVDIIKNNAILKIKDEGMGIPEAEKAYMFTRFFRASNALNIRGTGLGLTIVQQYVEMMGGKISFESEEGVGTTFTVRIPVL